jgi:DNA-binding transcriptional ArsR family regulator
MIDLIRDKGTMTVTDMYIKLRLEQLVASQYLVILRRAKVVVTDRQGKFIYYSVDEDRLIRIQNMVEGLISQ